MKRSMLPSIQKHPDLFSTLAFEDASECRAASRTGVMLLNLSVFHCAGSDQSQRVVRKNLRRLPVKVSALRARLNPKLHVATPAQSSIVDQFLKRSGMSAPAVAKGLLEHLQLLNLTIDSAPESLKRFVECLRFRSVWTVVLFVRGFCTEFEARSLYGLRTHKPHSRKWSVGPLLDDNVQQTVLIPLGSGGFHDCLLDKAKRSSAPKILAQPNQVYEDRGIRRQEGKKSPEPQ
jgi:hypothetical protein